MELACLYFSIRPVDTEFFAFKQLQFIMHNFLSSICNCIVWSLTSKLINLPNSFQLCVQPASIIPSSVSYVAKLIHSVMNDWFLNLYQFNSCAKAVDLIANGILIAKACRELLDYVYVVLLSTTPSLLTQMFRCANQSICKPYYPM